jgi:hypothetical protein
MIEQLGRDKTKNHVSSQPVIKTGDNRGHRKPEKDGEWVYMDGYDYHSNQTEKSIHFTWAKKLISLGFRVGYCDNDGVRNFYFLRKNKSI